MKLYMVEEYNQLLKCQQTNAKRHEEKKVLESGECTQRSIYPEGQGIGHSRIFLTMHVSSTPNASTMVTEKTSAIETRTGHAPPGVDNESEYAPHTFPRGHPKPPSSSRKLPSLLRSYPWCAAIRTERKDSHTNRLTRYLRPS